MAQRGVRSTSWIPRLARGLGAGVAMCALAGCLCTDQAGDYARARTDTTPRATVETFVLYWKADLHELEYHCFSRGFRQRNRGFSLSSYSVAREEMQRSLPFLAWFARARVIAEEELGGAEHRVWVEVAGRTVRVNLVREQSLKIWAGDELLAESFQDLERALTVEPDGGVRLKFEPEFTYRPFEDREVTLVRAESVWRIDDFAEVSRDSVPSSHEP